MDINPSIKTQGFEKLLETHAGKSFVLFKFPEPKIVNCKKPLEGEVSGSLNHVALNLLVYRCSLQGELRELESNPVRPQYNWWSTGALMNENDFLGYQSSLRHCKEQLPKVSLLVEKLESGTVSFPTLTEYRREASKRR